MSKNEISKISENLNKQLGRLELAMFNISLANQPYLPERIQNIINDELNRLRDIQDEIRNSMIELNEQNKTYIQKMLDSSKELCEENGDLVKGIVDTPKTNDEQIAENFVENYLPKNFVEDFLNKQ